MVVAFGWSATVAAAASTLPRGAVITATLQREIDTKTAWNGERFTMVTSSDSVMYGHLSQVVRSSATRKAHVKFDFDWIRFPDGTRASLHAHLTGITKVKRPNYVRGAAEVLGGMIVGNIIGKKLGTNAGGAIGLAGGALLAANTAYNIDIPQGAEAQIMLTEPLYVR
jgi:hypothetical protein